MAERIQRKRTKGWRMPEGAVYVGRPSRWGNPFTFGDEHPTVGHLMTDRADLVDAYRFMHDCADIFTDGDVSAAISDELRGKDLVCWCPLDQPCHADVLLEVANA